MPELPEPDAAAWRGGAHCPTAELCLPLKQQNVEVLAHGAQLLRTSERGGVVGGGTVE